MKSRRKGREFALQLLYANEICESESIGGLQLEHTENAIEAALAAKGSSLQYGRNLVEGILSNIEEVDFCINQHLKDWSWDRVALVDKLLLRVGVAELFYHKDVPVPVIITEAVQLAKKYSTQDSPLFINGVLDAVAKSISVQSNKE
ncbi:MAG: transcription antitermination factor NusB [Fibrobacteria bacterium]|nr:transcription antitermination factor NusB [Fibrobacteria bacterium]